MITVRILTENDRPFDYYIMQTIALMESIWDFLFILKKLFLRTLTNILFFCRMSSALGSRQLQVELRKMTCINLHFDSHNCKFSFNYILT